ncbi:hypothetical protein Slin14017_G100110 [Septoria linicola]|nr:hypothetical protein Slin14017_G100110 [Septoria linicola]
MLIMTVIILTLSFGQSVQAAEFGVGFNLNLDYGTASVYYRNGTTAVIAKIEGEPGYKQMMRSQAWILPHTDPAEGLAESAVYRKGQPVTTSQTRLQDFREQLPLWLGGNAPDDNIRLLSGMLESLKKAVEAYTEVEEIHVAGVVFPARPSASLTKTLFEAGRKISLKVHISSGAG